MGQVGSGFGVQTDLASASGSLRQLIFCIQVLVVGRGHVTSSDGKARGGQEDNEYGGDGIHRNVIQ